MKVLAVTLALVALVNSKSIDSEDEVDLKDITAFDYHTKIGIPLADRMRKAEAEPQSRIAGGSGASLGQFPFQVGLLIDLAKGQGVCGGSILNPQRVLTAAHCWFDGKNQGVSLTVVAESVTIFSGGQRIRSQTVLVNENWNPAQFRNDIAMVILPDSSIRFNNNVGSIRFATGSDTYTGAQAIISGFGRTGSGPVTQSQRLSYLNVLVISNNDCIKSDGVYKKYLQASNVCAKGGRDQSNCGGDSGGPLTVGSGNDKTQIGISSYGTSTDCPRNTPSAYTRVSSFSQWIQDRL